MPATSSAMIISLWALPDGIMGKQFSAWSTTTSTITGRSMSIISAMVSSTFVASSTRKPAHPKASASLTKSGSASV